MYKPKTPKVNAKANTTTQGTQTSSSPPTFLSLKSQRLTAGQLLADKVIPWRLKLQELFFPLFLKEVVPVSPESWGGGEGKTSALAFMERRPAQTKSSPKREALDGGSTSENNDVVLEQNTHIQRETHTYIHTHTRGVEGGGNTRLLFIPPLSKPLKPPLPRLKAYVCVQVALAPLTMQQLNRSALDDMAGRHNQQAEAYNLAPRL